MPGPPIVVVGGGIVGLAVARALRGRFPGQAITVLEKEGRLATHQTGHNSGVVHSGVYYRPGSLKARLCVEGRRRMIAFLEQHGLPLERCGKIIVATDDAELPRLEELRRRAAANGVEGLERLDADGIRLREPEARGRAGLWVPGTAITDYGAVSEALGRELVADGVELALGRRLLGGTPGRDGLRLETSAGPLEARYLVNCGGLQCDRIAHDFGVPPTVRIVPFRGEYYRLRRAREGLIRGLIYPVPDPAFPFLGVHFTKHIGGGVEAGPNAVLGLGREGYRRGAVDWRDLATTLAFPGFYRVVAAHLGMAVREGYRSLDRHRFAADLAKLVPSIGPDDLEPGGAGIRAQAVASDGRLLDDFHLVPGDRSLHVLNAPSPAATASLAIGEHIAAQLPALD